MEPRRHVLGPVTVSRIGFGAMQLPGPGLIRAALHPYPAGLALVSKVGARRDASGGVLRYDRGIGLSNVTPGHLRRALAGTAVASTAARLHVTPAQVALAWLLDLRPEVLLIPGTSSISHLEENLAVANIELDAEARDTLGES
jgi:hypothetical protein